jgi:hypothetical protein
VTAEHPQTGTGSSIEWQVLCECASPLCVPSDLQGLLRHANFDQLLEMAEHHGVTNLVALPMSEETAPAEFRARLQEAQRAHAVSALALIAEMLRILERFERSEIQALVLKGPALALQAYGDATARQFGDIDLLVRHRDVLRATSAMAQMGFSPRIPAAALSSGRVPGEYFFSRPASNVIAEIHTERTLRYFPNTLAVEELFARSVKLDANGQGVPSLSPEDALISACTHGAKHFWERLMWVADVAALVKRQEHLDWDRVHRTAAQLGARRIVNTGLGLAAKVLRAPLPAPVRSQVDSDSGASALADEIAVWLPAGGDASPHLLRRAAFRVRMRGGFWAGISYLTRLALSPTEEDWNKHHQHSPYREATRRLFRLVGKYGRNSN